MDINIKKKLLILELVDRRKTANLTQTELAKRAGLSVSCINALETGKQTPSLDTICKYAEALGLDLYLSDDVHVNK